MGCPGSWSNLARAVTVMSLVCLLMVVGIREGGGRTNMSSSTQAMGTSSSKRMEAEDDEAIVTNHAAGLDLNYMSNRRVPNGPDPIHNRRAGSSRRSPGKA